MKNIINVELPVFWINKENPRLVSYNPEHTEDWRPLQSEFYGHSELVKPKDNEIAYKYKGDDYRGFLLKNP
jgi:hypothetical protein